MFQLLVTGYGGVILFQNQGDGSFLEVTQQAGLDDRLWSSSAALAAATAAAPILARNSGVSAGEGVSSMIF